MWLLSLQYLFLCIMLYIMGLLLWVMTCSRLPVCVQCSHECVVGCHISSQCCTLQAVVALVRQSINNAETLEVTLSQRNTSARLPPPVYQSLIPLLSNHAHIDSHIHTHRVLLEHSLGLENRNHP